MSLLYDIGPILVILTFTPVVNIYILKNFQPYTYAFFHIYYAHDKRARAAIGKGEREWEICAKKAATARWGNSRGRKAELTQTRACT